MYEMAKKGREAMKSKAKQLAGEKSQKVDSSTWTPSEPLNADAKTGMRPVSRRAFKAGGKVSGEAAEMRADKAPRAFANAKVNRNVKAANEEREGVKHIGGMKKGGRAKKADGGMSDVLGGLLTSEAIKGKSPFSTQGLIGMASGKKGGGRAGKQNGGDAIADFLKKNPEPAAKAKDVPLPPKRPADVTPSTNYRDKYDVSSPYKAGGRTKKMDGGALKNRALGTPAGQVIPGSDFKKGGKVKHDDEAMDKALIKKMVKPAARTAHAKGGKVGKKGTNINIIISAGQKPPAGDMAMAPPPAMPGGIPIPAPAAGGAPPMPMPMPMPGPAAPPMGAMPRKTGGRVAKSYKDMTAGAGSGKGRLQKTEIEKSQRVRGA